MATLFQSFRSSSMPKRLLRYALSRLELLETDTLGMDKLDFALGRNTVFEFRDVRIKLKKLERLLKLPSSFKLEKARVLLLRVTIPMDFYASPISIEIDGVDVRLAIPPPDRPLARRPSESEVPDTSTFVPDTTTLAQSFLDTQSAVERQKLEEALAAETHDLGASVSMSDDGSEEESTYGTGQALSLPTFLADFLQGIMDRMQVRIKRVKCQLALEVPTDVGSSRLEKVAFQIGVDGVNVEGLTTPILAGETSSIIPPKEGKRHVSLDEVRAHVITEASLFSALSRSPSMASPSFASSSPAMTRNPPSRQTTSLSEMSTSSEAEHSEVPLEDIEDSQFESRNDLGIDDGLGDSEVALAIPYDLSDVEGDDVSPATPRASLYHDFKEPPEEPMFRSTSSVESPELRSTEFGYGLFSPSTSHTSPSASQDSHSASSQQEEPIFTMGDAPAHIHDALHTSGNPPTTVEDLTQSHLFTHEEAESMYMSVFSDARSRLSESLPEPNSEQPAISEPSRPRTPRPTMPGGWDESSDSSLSPKSERQSGNEMESRFSSRTESSHADTGVGTSPSSDTPPDLPHTSSQEAGSLDDAEPDDAATPKGPTQLAKEILSMSNITLCLPSQHQHLHVHAVSPESVAQLSQSLGQSIYPQAPGAFSVHSPTPNLQAATATAPENTQSEDNTLEVIFSPVKASFDTSLGFLLSMIVGKLVEAFQKDKPVEPQVVSNDDAAIANAQDVKLSLQELSIDFVNRMVGVSNTMEHYQDPSSFATEREVLLNATLQNLSISTSRREVQSKATGKSQPKQDFDTLTKIDVEKFRFGYADGDILTFDKTLPMSSSVRDAFLASGSDIEVKLCRSKEDIRTEVETLPMLLNIDLLKLDETFSWFGGLSSFLNMSSSMASSTSPMRKPAKPPQQKPRGVHFDTPIQLDDRSTQNKANVRIGGVRCELQGRDCSILAETSTVKLVNREEILAMTCSFLRASGPNLNNSKADPAIVCEIGNVRLEYSMTPTGSDLEKLVDLVTPSKNKFDDDKDEIMVETLLKQRRKGSVLRPSVENVNIRIKNLAHLAMLPYLGEELAKLSTVAKYLPEDDRPGLLTLGSVKRVNVSVETGNQIGRVVGVINQLDLAHITFPSLIAVAIHGITVTRNDNEGLINSIAPSRGSSDKTPVFMARMIGDEIEPIVKLKLQRLGLEYRVPMVMDILGLAEDATPQDFEYSLAASVAHLGDQAHNALVALPPSPTSMKTTAKPLQLSIGFQDCLIGLNPLNLPSKMNIALSGAHLQAALPHDGQTRATLDIRKASILLIDDVALLGSVPSTLRAEQRSTSSTSGLVGDLCDKGFVEISFLSSAQAVINISATENVERQVHVDLRDDLLVLSTCADSTQTLITLANALKPPTPPSKENKYRTQVVPVEDLLAKISAEAFGKPEGEYDFDDDFGSAQEMAGSSSDFEDASEDSLRIESQFYGDEDGGEEIFDATKSAVAMNSPDAEGSNEDQFVASPAHTSGVQSESSDDLVIQEDFYSATAPGGEKTKVWNSRKNRLDDAPDGLVEHSPLKIAVRDVHIIWKLFDGYDWASTREVINKAVQEVETRAYERQSKAPGQQALDEEVGDEETIGDFLFNSIYIGIPANRDPAELTRAINEGINDNATETESLATTTATGSTSRTVRPHGHRSRRLKLNRSRSHKITFELRGIDVDMICFPEGGGETLSSIDVRIKNLDIFDHIPTSTWKKFATYDQDMGERELGTHMVHLQIFNIKPLPKLAASEIVLRASVLPLRLHVDQDALDFITRFFEFKDEKVPVHASPSDVPFLQRAEVNSIPVKLDFKPKRVDYAGLRSGHTTEFMNLIVLEEARMVLRHVILYGVKGFDRLGKTLNDIWMPDIRTNQLPGVVAGLAPVRSLVNIGSGLRSLVEIPIREYQKDGRVIRSISKGAAAFAHTTGTEIVKLGAKIAVGTQYALQSAEGLLNEQRQVETTWDDDDLDEEERKQISLYADQPTGVIQGLRGGYRSLARDVNLARDAIIAVPGEIMESSSAGGAARAVWKKAPTIIFRPAVGVTKAIGQTLMGATNTIDPHNRRRIDEKYKKH